MCKELDLGDLYPHRKGRRGGEIDPSKLIFALREGEQQRRINREKKRQRRGRKDRKGR